MNHKCTVVGVLCLALALPAAAAMVRVDPGGGGDVLTVSDAMTLASAGDTIAVIQGPHSVVNVELKSAVELLGGWNATFTSRTPGSSTLQTTSQHVLTCTSGQSLATIVDGFVITGASRSALLLTGSSATITDNEFHGNHGIDGGAIHCEHGASPLIEYNYFHDNTAVSGAAIRGHWGADTSPIIRHNLIEYNVASVRGGGISVNNGSPIIEDNIIRNNSGGVLGGGVNVWHAEGGTVELRRNLIAFNNAEKGGGIGIDGGHPIIENNTLWGNSAGDGGALSQEESEYPDPGTTQVLNNILGGSLSGSGVFCTQDLAVNLHCNDVYGNAGGGYVGCPPGATDITLDPWFCDVDGGNFGIRSNSPCAPSGPSGCGLIGAYDVACGAVSVVPTSWAQIKSRYR